MSGRIPNIVHFIYGLKGPDEPLYYFHYLAVLSALLVNKPDAIYFHYQHRPSGPWWDEVERIVIPVQRAAREIVEGKRLAHYAHRADIMRLEVLIEQGGVYLDIDTLCLKPWHTLLDNPFVIGEESDRSLCNAVLMSEPGSEFARQWLKLYPQSFTEGEWANAACVLPHVLARVPGMGEQVTILPRKMLHEPTGPVLFDPGEVPPELLVAHWWGHIAVCDEAARRSTPALVRERPDIMFSRMILEVFEGAVPGE
jgi:hypothetical protein